MIKNQKRLPGKIRGLRLASSGIQYLMLVRFVPTLQRNHGNVNVMRTIKEEGHMNIFLFLE